MSHSKAEFSYSSGTLSTAQLRMPVSHIAAQTLHQVFEWTHSGSLWVSAGGSRVVRAKTFSMTPR